MEITDIREILGSPSAQGTVSIPPKKLKPPNENEQPERAKGDSETSELIKRIARGEPEALKGLTENLNRIMKSMRYNLEFVVDQEAGSVIIKVLDGEGNLIRQIPPEVMAGYSSKADVDLGFLLNSVL